MRSLIRYVGCVRLVAFNTAPPTAGMAELLRRSLRRVRPVDESKPWMRYAGMIETGGPSSSQRIDDIVYGRKD